MSLHRARRLFVLPAISGPKADASANDSDDTRSNCQNHWAYFWMLLDAETEPD
jgi:hypothetical protein